MKNNFLAKIFPQLKVIFYHFPKQIWAFKPGTKNILSRTISILSGQKDEAIELAYLVVCRPSFLAIAFNCWKGKNFEFWWNTPHWMLKELGSLPLNGKSTKCFWNYMRIYVKFVKQKLDFHAYDFSCLEVGNLDGSSARIHISAAAPTYVGKWV